MSCCPATTKLPSFYRAAARWVLIRQASYAGLAEAGVHPTWIAGVSIGALNTAIIAGNAPENRVKALQGFWKTICQPADHVRLWRVDFSRDPWALKNCRASGPASGPRRDVTEGQSGFFSPRRPLPMAGIGEANLRTTSATTKQPRLQETLLEFADFDRINDGDIRVSVGAVNVRNGNLVYFDNTKMRLRPEHFMASGALPPGFPAVEIDGEYYWDGGLVSNTPLTEIFARPKHKDTLVFQVDLWSARGICRGTSSTCPSVRKTSSIQAVRAQSPTMAGGPRSTHAPSRNCSSTFLRAVRESDPYFRHR